MIINELVEPLDLLFDHLELVFDNRLDSVSHDLDSILFHTYLLVLRGRRIRIFAEVA